MLEKAEIENFEELSHFLKKLIPISYICEELKKTGSLLSFWG